MPQLPRLTAPPLAPCQWEVDASLVVFKPSFDDTYFVLDSAANSSIGNGKRLNNDPNFHPGYRISVKKGCDCCREWHSSYTFFHEVQTRTVTGSNLFATLGHPSVAGAFRSYAGTARSKLDILYQRLDTNLVQQTLSCGDLDLNLQFGLELAYLRLHSDVDYQRAVGGIRGQVTEKSKAWGIGPQLGLGVDYALCHQFLRCLPGDWSLSALTSFSLLPSQTQAQLRSGNTNVESSNFSDECTWRLIPAVHATIGLNYETCLCGREATFGLSYEFSSYIRAVSRTLTYDDVGRGTSQNVFQNFDLQGFVFSGGIRF